MPQQEGIEKGATNRWPPSRKRGNQPLTATTDRKVEAATRSQQKEQTNMKEQT